MNSGKTSNSLLKLTILTNLPSDIIIFTVLGRLQLHGVRIMYPQVFMYLTLTPAATGSRSQLPK